MLLRRLVLWIIEQYRRTGGGSAWFGIQCNFEPSCSSYAHQAIHRFGLRTGFSLACDRMRRCTRPDSVCKCIEPVPERLGDAEEE